MVNQILDSLKKESKELKVSTIRDKTLMFIINLIHENKYQTMLEIGGGVGYSSYAFAKLTKLKRIVTIEKDSKRFLLMKKNLASLKKVLVINHDAFMYKPRQKFDFIFMDGPKSHQEDLVKNYLFYLNKRGMMIVDNIFLRKITSINHPTKNQLKLIKKLNQFQQWLLNNKLVNVKIIDIDDGIAIVTSKMISKIL